MSQPDRNVDAYRVGVLYALHFDLRAYVISRRKPTAIRHEIRDLVRLAKSRKWRALRRKFDGWHAEHRYAAANAGTGWTRKRAIADLRRHLDQLASERGGAK